MLCPYPGLNPVIRPFPEVCQPARQKKGQSPAQISSISLTIHTDIKAQSLRPSILTLRVPKSMADWEVILDPEIFQQLERSIILNISQIHTVSWLYRDETLVAFSGDAQAVTLGRTAAQRLKERLAREGAL